MTYKPTIGLEVHAELKTGSKMFCDCVNNPFEKEPNLNICPICAGHPGTLPVANKKAIELVIKTAKALNCTIAEHSKFDRKNYFYPDLPKGYQISQYDEPLSKNGFLEILVEEKNEENKFQIPNSPEGIAAQSYGAGKFQTNHKTKDKKNKRIRITRIHLEEDTGKLVHPEGADYSLVDLNRAGAPLMELVTEPDISSGAEAKKFCRDFQLILKYLGVSEADMEKGQMRCEVNISMSDTAKLGTKVEIKNLNSFKAVEKSIDYEIKRQGKALKNGEKIIQETRGWDENKGATFSQRAKEEAHDYRYFPEPDIPPLIISMLNIPDLEVIPELPGAKRRRFGGEYKLPAKDIDVIISDKKAADYFESAVSELKAWSEAEKIKKEDLPKVFKLLSNYFIRDLQKLLKEKNTAIRDVKITPENFAEFAVMLHKGRISSSAAQKVFLKMFAAGQDPEHVLEESGLAQTSDEGEIEKVVMEAIKNNPGSAGDYKKGKTQALQFLVGQVMSATKGKANPKIAIDLLKKKLENK